MILEKTVTALEYDKVLKLTAPYATLDGAKDAVLSIRPSENYSDALRLLKETEEGFLMLYTFNACGIPYYGPIDGIVSRAEKGATLTNRELLEIAAHLKSARLVKKSFSSVEDERIVYLKTLANNLFEHEILEKEITSKILSEDTVADSASPRLASIRRSIRAINAKIRDKLNSFIRGSNAYLQDSVVTMRMNRYVIPVKAECKRMVKGFVHDQSATGSTIYIEPESVVEYNNELKTAELDEQAEIYRILQELTASVSGISKALLYNDEILTYIDVTYAKARYAFETKSTVPLLNDKGIIDIKKGRHPLIADDKVIPVSVTLGQDYRYLLITGPNTGGKTVTMKLVGLLTMMAQSGFFVPAYDETKIAFFTQIFSDIGDEQSIEQSLSTFSSHMLNIIEFTNRLDDSPLVLLDELGAGTDPEEGSALALAVIEKLLEKKSFGIITTHYSKLKEFALSDPRIENASMDFDLETLKPVYKLNIGIPGSSNAIEISKRLGLSDEITSRARALLSSDKISYEKILKKAEETRQKAEKTAKELEILEDEKRAELKEIEALKASVKEEKDKITAAAKQEIKKIVSSRLQEAEEIVERLNEISKNFSSSAGDLITARTLKNKLSNSKYLEEELPLTPYELKAPDFSKLSSGDTVFIRSLGVTATVGSVNLQKKKVEIFLGSLKSTVPFTDVFNAEKSEKKELKVNRVLERSNAPVSEINLLGKTVLEAVTEVEEFLDQAVVHNLKTVRIVHGNGTGSLKKGIWEYLKTNKQVISFRLGKFGEGESGATVVTLMED